MSTQFNLDRFIQAQATTYLTALQEIKNGKKQSHWMWFIFPQIKGLGFSSTSKLYAIKDINEAKEYIRHTILAQRLIEISNALLTLKTNDAYKIFGSPDDMKLRSSMTLFSSVPGADTVFQKVLDKYFNGEKDPVTLNKLNKSS